MVKSTQPIALVTGANRGLGLETARQLGKLGYFVFLTARDESKAAAAAASLVKDGIKAEALALDVTRPETIAAAAQVVEKRFDHLDALVNNAGVAGGGFETPISQLSVDDVLQTFKTNTIGPMQVTQAFLPLLKKAKSPRIVNVSSGMGQLSDMQKGAPAYRVSKTALNAITKLFAIELQDIAAKVNAVCPGWVRTDMGGPSAHRSVEEGASGIVWAATLGTDGPSGGYFRDGKKLDW